MGGSFLGLFLCILLFKQEENMSLKVSDAVDYKGFLADKSKIAVGLYICSTEMLISDYAYKSAVEGLTVVLTYLPTSGERTVEARRVDALLLTDQMHCSTRAFLLWWVAPVCQGYRVISGMNKLLSGVQTSIACLLLTGHGNLQNWCISVKKDQSKG
ncbi:uncharacterized protein LOC141679151 isoform X1 [Apium graveolens]|uniref:uncharacterized protein LOC141679151 isoform X1 n=1 Tax=Apium graveolens TaxID=4045 RepID=UPI003D7A12DD